MKVLFAFLVFSSSLLAHAADTVVPAFKDRNSVQVVSTKNIAGLEIKQAQLPVTVRITSVERQFWRVRLKDADGFTRFTIDYPDRDFARMTYFNLDIEPVAKNDMMPGAAARAIVDLGDQVDENCPIDVTMDRKTFKLSVTVYCDQYIESQTQSHRK
jgi:hypothetical protein